MNVRSLGCVFAATALAALSGCGGGGGGPPTVSTPTVSTPTVPTPTVPTPPPTLGQGLSKNATHHAELAALAAESEPRAGSVTQSSNTESGSDTTADRVVVDFRAGTYTIENKPPGAADSKWEISTANATALPDDITADANAIGLVEPEDGGHRFVVAQTRPPTEGNTDWLTAGIWAFVPADVNDLTSYEFGAFADGGDVFDQDELQALTGEASYVGRAFGVYYSISPDNTSDAGPFGGQISLTADFDEGQLGTVRGSVTGIIVEGGERIPGAGLLLNPADIGSAPGGFFTGGTSMTLNGRTYGGRWGGQFFGNGAAGAQPGSVAGTFGASAREDGSAAALVGAFAADRWEAQ